MPVASAPAMPLAMTAPANTAFVAKAAAPMKQASPENAATVVPQVMTAVAAVPRIRLIGGDASALAEALGGSPDIAVFAGEVTRAGRVELLPFLLEQSISATAHRFGNPSALLDDVLPAVEGAASGHPEAARVD